MIKHIVMFKLADKNNKDIEELERMLLGLKEKIAVLESLEVGVNYADSERAMDLVLVTTFENRDALESYRIHPDHQLVVLRVKELCSQSKVVDFEF